MESDKNASNTETDLAEKSPGDNKIKASAKEMSGPFEVISKGIHIAQSKGSYTLEEAHILYLNISLMKKYLNISK